MNLDDLQRMSASPTELVLPLVQALEAIDLMASSNIAVLGWEGWLRHVGGRLGHSNRHQGTAGDEPFATAAGYAWIRETMQDSHAAHLADPEVDGSELLFCITAAT
jgi:hypothetical protein